MNIVLIPGLWLDSSSWDQVVPLLQQAGHRTYALTLPGMETADADRSGVTLRNHIDAAIAAVDALDPADGKVVLVGHSMGGGIAHAVADARPDRVARVIYVGAEPRGTDDGSEGMFPIVDGEVPLPDWSFFDDDMVVDLDDELRATIREQSIPSPARVTQDPQQLTDDRRYDIPATVIALEYSSEMLQKWTAEAAPGTEELGKLHNLEYVDLPGGHWPQFAQPEALSRLILTAIGSD
jgi:pimeloyl-ACP methyl ester carboxylesterase